MIDPAYRVLMRYDIHPDKQERYYRYMLSDFVPAMQQAGLFMVAAWQVTYGNYPSHQIEFVCEDRETLRTIITGDEWKDAEQKLISYTRRYTRKIVRFEERFQF